MKYLVEEKYVHEFLNLDGIDYMVGHDDGSQIECLSPFRYYVNQSYGYKRDKKDLHYNNIPLPEFWGVYPDGFNGMVMDKYVRKANIYFKEPIIKRYVKSVEWLEEESVYRRDFYDCYGAKYYSEYLNNDGDLTDVIYYGKDGKEVVIYQPKNEVFFLLENGMVNQVMYSYKDFFMLFLEDSNNDGI